MPRYLVQVLGPPVVADTRSGATIEFPAGKTLALLAYLTLHPAPPLRDQLYHLLWADSPRERGLQSVRQALWLIRHTFGESALGGRDGTTVDRELLGSDVAVLEQAIASGQIDEAERVWRGPFLDRFAVAGAPEWDRWAEETRLRLEHEYGTALAAAAAGDAARSNGDGGIQRYGRAIQVEPFRPEHRLALLDLLLELRRGPDAEQALDAARSALPDPEFAPAFADRELRLREVLRDRAFEPIAALSRPELVGRAHELADLIARWNLVRRGRTQRVVLHGRSGVGKTRLAEELAAVVEQDRGRVVVVKTTEPESALPWATIATLVRRLLVLPGAGGVSAGSDAVLRRLVPSLARHAPGEHGHSVTEPAVLADALSDLIGAVAYEAPLLILLDDGQWIDVGSWALLSRLLTQIETDPVLFLLTVREGEAPAQVERALARVQRGTNALAIRLANLSRAETAELLTFVLGSEQAVAGGLGDRIFSATRGNPLFVVETTKMLRDVGALRLTGERWVFDASRVPERFPLPDNIEQLLRQRVEKLSPTAERIARMLAQGAEPRDVASLQPAGVSRNAWADAIGELVDRGVVLRTDEGYVLAHEQIAAVVRAGPQRPRRRWLVAAVATAALLLFGLAGVVALRPGEAYYGGGSIYMSDDSGFLLVRPPVRLLHSWRVSRIAAPIPPGASFRAVRRIVDGRVLWGATMLPLDSDPYAIDVNLPGAPVVWRDTTDVEVQDISPAGDRFLLGWDNSATTGYDIAALSVGRDGSAPRRLMQFRGLGAGMSWSRDGTRVGGVSVGGRDTLHVVTAGGLPLRRVDLGTAGTFDWCADGTIILSRNSQPLGLRRYFIEPDSMAEFPAGAVDILPGRLLCAPDGRHALATAVIDGLRRLSIVNLENGQTVSLPEHLQGFQPRAWLPDAVPPVPHRVHLDSAALTLAVGEKRRPRTIVIYTDSSARAAEVELISSDQRTLTVLPDSSVVALRPGKATLTARYAGWLTDSATVTVTASTDSTLRFEDDFERLDTTRWHIVGLPVPVPVTSEGEAVLQLTGDGNLTDGLISKFAVPGAQGITAELEFRLTLTRPDRQRIQFGLCPSVNAPEGNPDFYDPSKSVHFLYPDGELGRFGPSQVALSGFGYHRGLEVPRLLPAAGWTHAAVQLQADGYAELVLNHTVVARSLLRHPDPGAVAWRICLFGASVETELLVRGLRVWRGVRY